MRAGTTGVGVDLGGDVLPTLGWRLGLSGMNVNTDVETSQVAYDAKVKVLTGSLLLDWSPLGPFRISAGFMPNNNKIDLTGRPSGGSFPPGSTLTGEVKPERSFAPYLGVGYGNVWTKGVNFYFDLGVMFQGTPEVSLTLNCAPSASCTRGTRAGRSRAPTGAGQGRQVPVLPGGEHRAHHRLVRDSGLAALQPVAQHVVAAAGGGSAQADVAALAEHGFLAA